MYFTLPSTSIHASTGSFISLSTLSTLSLPPPRIQRAPGGGEASGVDPISTLCLTRPIRVVAQVGGTGVRGCWCRLQTSSGHAGAARVQRHQKALFSPGSLCPKPSCSHLLSPSQSTDVRWRQTKGSWRQAFINSISTKLCSKPRTCNTAAISTRYLMHDLISSPRQPGKIVIIVPSSQKNPWIHTAQGFDQGQRQS